MHQSKFAAALGGLLIASMSSAFAMGGRPAADSEGASSRIAPVARVQLAAAAPAGGGKERTGEELYTGICGACHDTGVAGAPKTGDKAAWAPRIKLGLDGLTKSAIAGKGAMPPKGGADASETELANAIVFMTNKSGAGFKEVKGGGTPAAAAAPAARSGEQVVQVACSKCHDGGDPKAPRIGDKAAWAPRAAKGLDTLVKIAIKGHDNMPARGGLADTTDAELRAAIEYMFNAAK